MAVNRQQQKAETRQKLLQAALSELGSGRSFDSLSLREVAKSAGIAPTSFYRHFEDMESLGLALMEEGGQTLRQLMNDVRSNAEGAKSLIRASVDTLFDYFSEHPELLRMIFQGSLSGREVFRRTGSRLMQQMSKDLADYLSQEAASRGVAVGEVAVAADAMVAIMFRECLAMLDQSKISIARKKEAAVTQLKMVMLGAEELGRRC